VTHNSWTCTCTTYDAQLCLCLGRNQTPGIPWTRNSQSLRSGFWGIPYLVRHVREHAIDWARGRDPWPWSLCQGPCEMLPCIGIGIRICIDGWRMHLRYPSLGCSVRNDGNDLMKIALNLFVKLPLIKASAPSDKSPQQPDPGSRVLAQARAVGAIDAARTGSHVTDPSRCWVPGGQQGPQPPPTPDTAHLEHQHRASPASIFLPYYSYY
jgi:hypothetical protein